MIEGVYVNRTLNLKKIKYLGLDMDHTLVRYHSKNFEELAHQEIIKKLVSNKKYPEEILEFNFEYERAIRGLVIDREAGNILKLNRHAGIRVSYHGSNKIGFSEQKKRFQGNYVDLSEPAFDAIDTTFSISFAHIYTQLVDLKDTKYLNELPAYNQIAIDIKECLDQAHGDGTIKEVVKNNLDKYIIRDSEIIDGLERYKRLGKKLFIVTNSLFPYTDALLKYTIDPYLSEHSTWSDLFDITITGAKKPRFFWDKLDFFKIDPSNGNLTYHEKKLTPGIYHGGSARAFANYLELDGEDILYIGDHIYGDIVRLKKDCYWRTGLVVEELKEERDRQRAAKPIDDKIADLMDKKHPLEMKLVKLITNYKEGKPDETGEYKDLLDKIQEIDTEISGLIPQYEQCFNKYWGEIMRIGNEDSFFASQVERYACIYMSELKDLLRYSPLSYFRGKRRHMPHEDHL